VHRTGAGSYGEYPSRRSVSAQTTVTEKGEIARSLSVGGAEIDALPGPQSADVTRPIRETFAAAGARLRALGFLVQSERYPILPVTHHLIDASTPCGRIIAERALESDTSRDGVRNRVALGVFGAGVVLGLVLFVLWEFEWMWFIPPFFLFGIGAFLVVLAFGSTYTSEVAVVVVDALDPGASAPAASIDRPLPQRVTAYAVRARSSMRSGRAGSFRSLVSTSTDAGFAEVAMRLLEVAIGSESGPAEASRPPS
jgi:hypothetical protein